MLSASGLSATGAILGVGMPAGGLDAQLGRLQQQLSDCVNCPTAQTTEGKSKIQAVSDQISAIKARMEQAQRVSVNQVQDVQPVNKTQASFDNSPVQGSTIGGVINISV